MSKKHIPSVAVKSIRKLPKKPGYNVRIDYNGTEYKVPVINGQVTPDVTNDPYANDVIRVTAEIAVTERVLAKKERRLK